MISSWNKYDKQCLKYLQAYMISVPYLMRIKIPMTYYLINLTLHKQKPASSNLTMHWTHHNLKMAVYLIPLAV